MTDWNALFGPDYPKIDTVFERDGRGVIIPDKPVSQEIAYLWGLPWEWTEKVNGTNVRLHWNGERAYACGRETNAQVDARLLAAITPLLDPATWRALYPGAADITVYGEGYGGDIQNEGPAYREDPALVVFDVNIGGWWLSRENVKDVAGKLGLDVVPLYLTATIAEAVALTREGKLTSHWEGARIEGLVGRPAADLYTKKGARVLAKMKVKDWEDYRRSLEPKPERERTGRKGTRPNTQSFDAAAERIIREHLIENSGEQGVTRDFAAEAHLAASPAVSSAIDRSLSSPQHHA